ncbi:hypothetical protein BEH94_11370 [Candidatus Altiarchaeales archaeon WOR_SM1_SCG]|nr:hypothetical protein BEH94_11370 [Candidatus Altiarchaeales archaeon WOR_SM1_SCG]
MLLQSSEDDTSKKDDNFKEIIKQGQIEELGGQQTEKEISESEKETYKEESVEVEDSKKVNETESEKEKIDDEENFEETSPVISISQENKSNGRKIMLLIDISGSFTEKGETVSKIEDVKIKAVSIIEAINEEDRLGVIAFDEDTYIVQHITGGEFGHYGRNLSKKELIDKILSISTTPTQGTMMSKPLKEAQIELSTEGGYVILLSDGRLNFNWDVERSKDIAREMAEDNIIIMTVGIGKNIVTPFLKELSEITNGTYYESEELSGLELDTIIKRE